MSERPILFSNQMVQALLAGRKTQTRRILKAQPDFSILKAEYKDPNLWEFRKRLMMYESWHGYEHAMYRKTEIHPDMPVYQHRSPYGEPGERLWVRESFWGCDMPGYGDQPCVVYDDEWHGKEYRPTEIRPWARKFGRIPSIHMPRDCSRITLEITDVRVERLQDISESDAQAEGIPIDNGAGTQFCRADNRQGFRQLWESINGADSWDANPWVWVVEFKRA